MATRSAIGIHEPDGTVSGVYAHWDGGLEWVGRLLHEHYRHPDKIRALIGHGSVSSLGPEIGERHPFSEWRPEWCTFYGRDRGDTHTAAVVHEGPDAFYRWARSSGAEFVYLHTGGQWRFIPATHAHATTDHELWDELAEVLRSATRPPVGGAA